VDPVPDSLLLRKSGSAGNRIRTSGSAARNHRGGPLRTVIFLILYNEEMCSCRPSLMYMTEKLNRIHWACSLDAENGVMRN
jgi:hypothetical protein